MTSDLDALLAAVLADPADDTVRLVYADALDEAGEHDRAEFIRVMCEYARLHSHLESHQSPGCETCARGFALSELLVGKFRVPRNGPLPFAADCPHRLMGLDGYTGRRVEWDWHRGFVCEVRCTAEQWVFSGDAIRARHPVERVTLNDLLPERIPLEEGYRPLVWAWRVGSVPRRILGRLRGLKLTAWHRGDGTVAFDTREKAVAALCQAAAAEWPGVAFTLPEPVPVSS